MGEITIMDILDVRTLLAAVSFTLVVSSIALFAHWRSALSLKGLGYFSSGFAVQALGTWILILRGEIPFFISLFGGNLLVLWGYGLMWAGFNVFWSKPLKNTTIVTGVATLFMLIFQYMYGVMVDDLNIRVVVVNSLNILVLLGICGTLWVVQSEKAKVQGSAVQPTYYGVWLVFLGYASNAVFNLYRVVTWDISGPPDQLFAPEIGSVLGYTGGLILAVLVPLGIIIMTSECLEARVKAAVILDILTGAYNRDAFEENVRHAIAKAKRSGETFSLLVIDLDDFKSINDTHGHAIGDTVLSVIGRRILGQKRESDIFGRVGGDEFVLLLPETSPLGARHVAERIRDLIRNRPIYDTGKSVSITVSIGIATSDQDGHSYSDLFKRADKALYEAKRSGRDKVISET